MNDPQPVAGTDLPDSAPPPEPEVGDHYRAGEDAPVSPGHYRVVGVHGDTVTLLHVGDAAGVREHTGRVESVDRRALPGLGPAEAPGGVLDDVTGALEAANLLGALLLRAAAAGLPR